jgi:ABC-type glycerol-3-phosphate transport system substrate-binding protein
LNAFEQDGKRFIIPLRYAASAFITSKGALKRNNIEIDPSNCTYEEFLKIADKYMANNKGNKKYFICDFDIKALIKGTRTSFVDFYKQKIRFQFYEFIEIWKSIKDSILQYGRMKN